MKALTQSPLDKNKISLQSGQNRDVKIAEPLCLEFKSDFQTRLFIIGQSYSWTLPKGTKYVVEPGDYHLENPGPAVLDFALLPVAICGN